MLQSTRANMGRRTPAGWGTPDSHGPATVPVAPARGSEGVHHMGDHAPNHQTHLALNLQRRIVRMLRHQPDPLTLDLQALQGQLTIDGCHHDRPGLGLARAVHHQQIAVADPGTGHGIPLHPQEESRGRMPDQLLVQIDGPFQIVVGRRGEAGRDTRAEEGKRAGERSERAGVHDHRHAGRTGSNRAGLTARTTKSDRGMSDDRSCINAQS
ncbi:hypothetical protein THIOKS13190002 [Thiocapsa sp. KS1]|nr:hypothetical protein THIOKS13190002 [Thiocapsa sp. KS1]